MKTSIFPENRCLVQMIPFLFKMVQSFSGKFVDFQGRVPNFSHPQGADQISLDHERMHHG